MVWVAIPVEVVVEAVEAVVASVEFAAVAADDCLHNIDKASEISSC